MLNMPTRKSSGQAFQLQGGVRQTDSWILKFPRQHKFVFQHCGRIALVTSGYKDWGWFMQWQIGRLWENLVQNFGPGFYTLTNASEAALWSLHSCTYVNQTVTWGSVSFCLDVETSRSPVFVQTILCYPVVCLCTYCVKYMLCLLSRHLGQICT